MVLAVPFSAFEFAPHPREVLTQIVAHVVVQIVDRMNRHPCELFGGAMSGFDVA